MPPAPVARGTLSNVQLLRFVAAGAILTLHAADLFLPNDWAFWSEPWTGGVDIFFVISGFIIAYLAQGRFGARGAPAAFLVRRAIRIAPPYWLFTTLMVVWLLLHGSELGQGALTPAQIATSYFFTPWPSMNSHLIPLLPQGWTLNYEAFFYLSFTLALAFRRGLLWLAGGFVALVALHPFVPPHMFALYFWSDPIILEFLAGIGLAQFYLRGVRLPFRASLLCVALAAAIYLLTQSAERAVHLGIPALLLSAALILAPEPRAPGALRRALQAGGDISYTLYLSHIFTVGAVAAVGRRAGLDSPLAGMALAMIAAILVAAILYRWVERPITELLRRRAGLSR